MTTVDPEDEIRKIRKNLFYAIEEVEQSLKMVENEIYGIDEKLKKEIGYHGGLGKQISEEYMEYFMDINNRILLLCRETEDYDDSVLCRLEKILDDYVNL